MSSFNLSSLNPNTPAIADTAPPTEPPKAAGNDMLPILSPRLDAALSPPILPSSLAVLPPASPVKNDLAWPATVDMAVDVMDDVTCPATTFLNTLVVALMSPSDAM